MIDMGNSAIKWAYLRQNVLSPQQRIVYNDHLEAMLTQTWLPLEKPSGGIWVSNVAGPQKSAVLTQWVKKNWDLSPNFVESAYSECGVKNGYTNPKQLGIDRWLALIGAYNMPFNPQDHFKNSLICVMDCGTAVTLDVLAGNGQHQGGVIMPGVNSLYQSLFKNTHALPQLDQALPLISDNSFLGHETHTGIILGSLYAITGLLEHTINRLEKTGNQVILILTGFDAPQLFSLLQRPYQYIPDLVLRGLQAVVNQSL
jgi:type III pantothenate kinase